MKYNPWWPSDDDDKARSERPRRLPLGVLIAYEKGDDEELHHVLDFLHSHFALGEKDFDATIDVDEPRFPRSWVGEKLILFKRLLNAAESGKTIGETITLGFSYEHLLIFRAYKTRLDQDTTMDEGVKELFAEIEDGYFGTPSHLDS
ncbi:MAG: hypothetical protein Q7S52_02840 [bacterium]|nr:hypothetical protein [bacterium]